MYAPNYRASKCVKQKVTELKEKFLFFFLNSAITLGEFSAPLSTVNRARG